MLDTHTRYYPHFARFSNGERMIVIQWYDDIDKDEFIGPEDGATWKRTGAIIRHQLKMPKVDDVRWEGNETTCNN